MSNSCEKEVNLLTWSLEWTPTSKVLIFPIANSNFWPPNLYRPHIKRSRKVPSFLRLCMIVSLSSVVYHEYFATVCSSTWSYGFSTDQQTCDIGVVSYVCLGGIHEGVSTIQDIRKGMWGACGRWAKKNWYGKISVWSWRGVGIL